MFGFAGAVLTACVFGPAYIAARGTGWWTVSSVIAGGLVALAVGSWLQGNSHDDPSRVMLSLGAIILNCRLVASAAQFGDLMRSRVDRPGGGGREA